MQIHLALDREFKRVAQAEGVTMEELVAEVASLTGKKARQIYNYRSGKWLLPPDLFPVLCQRFRSLALVDALRDECRATEVDVPESYDLSRLVAQTVRDDMKHYEQFLAAFEDGVIEPREMADLRESGARVVQNVRQFEAIAEADFKRRQSLSTKL